MGGKEGTDNLRNYVPPPQKKATKKQKQKELTQLCRGPDAGQTAFSSCDQIPALFSADRLPT